VATETKSEVERECCNKLYIESFPITIFLPNSAKSASVHPLALTFLPLAPIKILSTMASTPGRTLQAQAQLIVAGASTQLRNWEWHPFVVRDGLFRCSMKMKTAGRGDL
jgi:hypothetical protein